MVTSFSWCFSRPLFLSRDTPVAYSVLTSFAEASPIPCLFTNRLDCFEPGILSIFLACSFQECLQPLPKSLLVTEGYKSELVQKHASFAVQIFVWSNVARQRTLLL